MRFPTPTTAIGLALLVALAACGGDAGTESVSSRVENSDLGIAIAALPQPLVVAVNEGTTLRLTAPGNGVMEVAIGPLEDGAINLVEEVKNRRAQFEAVGEYLGNTELGSPVGTAFTARGVYDGEAGRVEETWICALHPGANRLLTLTYRYPAAEDSQERVGHLLALLGELEGIPFPIAVDEPTPEADRTAD